MRCERLTLNGDPGALAAELRQLAPTAASVSESVAGIIERVSAEGDHAVLDYTRRFDTAGADPKPLRVEEDELDGAVRDLDPAVRRGLERAIANVTTMAGAAAHREATTVDLGSHVIRLHNIPVHRGAVYVPGGRAPYPSTVVMGAIPARVAGVEAIVV